MPTFWPPERAVPTSTTATIWLWVRLQLPTPGHRLITNDVLVELSSVYLTQRHISPPKVITQLPKPNKDLSISPFLLIDDNYTKIWKLSSFGFMLHAQAILPCVKDFGQVPQTLIGSISSSTYVLECLV